ncbi:putative protein-like [Raphanus sativus]|nr:putative protein-like [Raphanus sativus]KAJ4900105.1 putative protein-like [Raphanus sativus]
MTGCKKRGQKKQNKNNKKKTTRKEQTKAAVKRSTEKWIPRTRLVLSWDEGKETQQQWTLSLYKSNGVDEMDEGAPVVDEKDEGAHVVDEGAPAVDETDEGAPAVDKGTEGAEGDPARIGGEA